MHRLLVKKGFLPVHNHDESDHELPFKPYAMPLYFVIIALKKGVKKMFLPVWLRDSFISSHTDLILPLEAGVPKY